MELEQIKKTPKTSRPSFPEFRTPPKTRPSRPSNSSKNGENQNNGSVDFKTGGDPNTSVDHETSVALEILFNQAILVETWGKQPFSETDYFAEMVETGLLNFVAALTSHASSLNLDRVKAQQFMVSCQILSVLCEIALTYSKYLPRADLLEKERFEIFNLLVNLSRIASGYQLKRETRQLLENLCLSANIMNQQGYGCYLTELQGLLSTFTP